MRIIPAIDILDGKCVRLTKGDYGTSKVYSEDPLEVARQFEDSGLQYLHLVDLDGARSNHIVNYHVLEAIATQTSLTVDFAGGIKSDEDVRTAFESGASQITGGTVAVQDPPLFLSWLGRFGPEKIILGADARGRKVATRGWLESTTLDVVRFIADYQKQGIIYTVCTDIARDGMLQGAATSLYREILANTEVKLIASGGVSSLEDLAGLADAGCDGAIIGKAIYEGTITLNQLRELC
jgi:phosphoribosylformimino-5-aminoimidazole carboxamide ribotide isomerase